MKKNSRVVVFAMARKGRNYVGLTTTTLVNLEKRSRMDKLTQEAWPAYLDCYYVSEDFLQSSKFNAILRRDALV